MIALRRYDREITDLNEIEKILEKAEILHLGLLDEGYPYVVPLHYGYELVDGKLTFYMHGAKQGHKLDLIKKNPHVFVELECDVSQISGGDVPCKYGSSFASVMGRGNAEIVEDVSVKIQGLKDLMQNQTGKDFEITEKMTKIVSVIKVTMSDFTAKKRSR